MLKEGRYTGSCILRAFALKYARANNNNNICNNNNNFLKRFGSSGVDLRNSVSEMNGQSKKK